MTGDEWSPPHRHTDAEVRERAELISRAEAAEAAAERLAQAEALLVTLTEANAEHNLDCEGEAECPACIRLDLRAALSGDAADFPEPPETPMRSGHFTGGLVTDESPRGVRFVEDSDAAPRTDADRDEETT